jgi:HEAT repeat protein
MASLTTRVTVAFAWMILIARPGWVAADDARVAAFDPTAIDRVDYVMNLDPELGFPPHRTIISTAAKAFWVRALARNDVQLQRVTIDTIVLAHRRGMKDLEDLVPKLSDHLQQPNLHPQLLYALCAALIEFDAKDQAELLAKRSQANGLAIASLVEPALARWQSPALAGQWLRRLDDPTTDRLPMLHAIDGLAALGETKATASLLRIIFDQYAPPNVRMSAARAVGKIQARDLEPEAAKLADQADSANLPGLMAVAMMRQHDGEVAIEVLHTLAGHENTSVQSGALGRLFAIDPMLVSPHAEAALASSDVNVRRLGARAMIALPRVDRIASLGKLLDDVNPDLRQEVAAALVHLAKQDDLRDEVIEQSSIVLGQNHWRGCEQAATVLVNLDHKPAGSRLVDLMNHERYEVMVASAWGLRRLALPEHLPAMLDQANSVLVGFRDGRWNASMWGPERQISQLFMAFGQMGHHPADELMRQYIPKDYSLGDTSRPAAIWGLGLLHEGKAPDDLTRLFLARLNDVQALEPETGPVRFMSAISLGRMGSQSAVPQLRKFANPGNGFVGLASLWAIEQLTGELPPPLTSKVQTYDDWFLGPAHTATD